VSVFNSNDFVRSVGAEFSHDVTPIAFDIRIEAQHGWAFEKACGSAELNSLAAGATTLTLSSEFASPLNESSEATGGIFLVKLRPPSMPDAAVPPSTPTPSRRCSPRQARSTSADGSAGPIVPNCMADVSRDLPLKVTWEDSQGLPTTVTTVLRNPELVTAGMGSLAAAAARGPPVPNALRKALALVRFVDLQSGFCDGSDSDGLQVRRARLEQCRQGRDDLLREMAAVGDDTLGAGNANLLQTLEQIITLEAREVGEMEQAEAASMATAARTVAPLSSRATRAAKRALAAESSKGSASGSRHRARMEPPAAYLCPITKMLMSDPVCTADGHTFERQAIALWLQTHNNSPLTGLALESKALTANHTVRGLIREWQAA